MDEDPAGCERRISRKEIYSAKIFRAQKKKKKKYKKRSPKTTAKAEENVYWFFKQYFGSPYVPDFFRLTESNGLVRITLKQEGHC